MGLRLLDGKGGIGPRTCTEGKPGDSSKVLESNGQPLGLSSKYHELDLEIRPLRH